MITYTSRQCYFDPYRSDKFGVHDISGLLKLYFRELPVPIFPPALHTDIFSVVASQSHEEKLTLLKSILHSLPPTHFETLKVCLRLYCTARLVKTTISMRCCKALLINYLIIPTANVYTSFGDM